MSVLISIISAIVNFFVGRKADKDILAGATSQKLVEEQGNDKKALKIKKEQDSLSPADIDELLNPPTARIAAIPLAKHYLPDFITRVPVRSGEEETGNKGEGADRKE